MSHPDGWFITSFWKMSSRKDTKNVQQDDKKLGRKDNLKSGPGLSQTRPRLSSLTAVVEEDFAMVLFNVFISNLTQTLNYATMHRGKKLNHFERFLLRRYLHYFHRTKFTTSNGVLSTYLAVLQFCLALYTVKCGLVSEWVPRANPHLFICFEDQ